MSDLNVIDIRGRLNARRGEYLLSLNIYRPWKERGFPSASVITSQEWGADMKREVAGHLLSLAKVLFEDAEPENGEIVAQFRVYDSGTSVGRIEERVDTTEGRAWLKNQILSFDAIIDPPVPA